MTEDVHADLSVPSWPELSGLMAAAFRVAVAGTVRVTGSGAAPRTIKLWHRSADERRFAEVDGEPLYISDVRAQWIFDRPGEPPSYEVVHSGGPSSTHHEITAVCRPLVGRVMLDDYWWETTPSGISAGTRIGRPTWEYETEDGELVAVDAATGVRLFRRLGPPGYEHVVEFTDFTPDAVLGDELFEWDGPMLPIPSTAQFEELLDQPYDVRAATARWAQVPRYWPGGVGMNSSSGNWITGAYRTVLTVPAGRYPVVVDQRPEDGAPFQPDDGAEHVYSWNADGLRFTLVAGIPLSEDDLNRVQESMIEI
ncbi:hypothetical protein ACFQ05_20910 [Amycolatopsis umgeniensis]|uniref:Uncharacterized protein n=1 Tax=Amycolatopsis umgeniensis TaxID=336628 RepID=A0A841BB70_9PSEU|nr:hypothetical protein [Amycolatopsis umgeniensis]MBB5858079.1 hypothetical protein [Amycolatopsis umgeniensis]